MATSRDTRCKKGQKHHRSLNSTDTSTTIIDRRALTVAGEKRAIAARPARRGRSTPTASPGESLRRLPEPSRRTTISSTTSPATPRWRAVLGVIRPDCAEQARRHDAAAGAIRSATRSAAGSWTDAAAIALTEGGAVPLPAPPPCRGHGYRSAQSSLEDIMRSRGSDGAGTIGATTYRQLFGLAKAAPASAPAARASVRSVWVRAERAMDC